MSTLAIRALLGLPGLFILTTGLVFLFSPEAALEKLRLSAAGAEGLSNIRGMAGAPLFAVGLSLILGAATEKLEYVRPAVFFVLALVGARLLSYAVDGPVDAIGLFIAVPAAVFAMLAAAHMLLAASRAATHARA